MCCAAVFLQAHVASIPPYCLGVSDHDLLFSRQAQDQQPGAEEGRAIINEMEGEQSGVKYRPRTGTKENTLVTPLHWACAVCQLRSGHWRPF